jgi:hypothetical protein
MPDFARVIGRFVTIVADSGDVGTEPDIVPLSGRVMFKLDQAKVVETNASPQPMVIVSTPIEGVLDSSGFLNTPDAEGDPAYQGIWLLANNDPDVDPATTTYTVTYFLFNGATPMTLPPHSLSLAAGTTTDLALVIGALI